MTVGEWLTNAGLSLIPPTLVGLVFYVVMRSILRADSKERQIYSKMEAEMRAERETETGGKKTAKAKTKKDA